MKILNNTILILFVLSLVFTACSTKDESPIPTNTQTTSGTIVANTIRNLPANPEAEVHNTDDGHFTFFSLETGTIVGLADSATTKWDIGFRSTTIIFNGGTSGPGNAAGQIYIGTFDELTTGPSGGYKQDNSKAVSAYAIATGSGNGWYNYNSDTHIISAIPGRVIVVRTANNKYAKVEIISYYKDAPVAPVAESIARYYTFRYVYQSDGSLLFN